MKKYHLFLLLVWLHAVNAFGQANQLLVKVTHSSSYPSGSQGLVGTMTANSTLNSILSTFNAVEYAPSYPAAFRSDAPVGCAPLKNYYTIVVSNPEALKTSLQSCSSCNLTDLTVLTKPVPAYTPNDYSLLTVINPNANWYLDKIEAKKAWDISKSSPYLQIALIDEGYDLNNQDFAGNKIFYSDALTYPKMDHGTACASLAAGKTDDGIGMSSIGFNSSLAFYSNGPNSLLEAALNGAHVVNISELWSSDPVPGQQLLVNQVYAMGVFIVAAAGNGPSNGLNPEMQMYPASYNHVFSVTGVWSNDAHRFQGDPTSDPRKTQQHNLAVDLCAPAYHIMHSIPGNNYDVGDGTSFAAPLVAGTVALIKSEFPCLTNDEIELILKESSDEIYSLYDNNRYAGKLGAGRLNAGEALKLAQQWSNVLIVNSNENILINKSGKYSSILVKKNGRLSVSNSTLFMLPDAKITVEAGGKLMLANTIIKSVVPSSPTSQINCGSNVPYKWKGISIEGNPTLSQTPTNQGYVSMSSSTIQDATNAVSTFAVDANGNIVWGKSGGAIIVANNTTFRNNGRHLEFSSYHSKASPTAAELNNASNFRGCKFFVDDGTILHFGNKKMITLWDVKGIIFSACEFKNDFDLTSSNKGTAILAVEAGLIVQNDKQSGGGRSLFSNLEYGINASFSPNSSKLLFLNNSDFVANKFGLYLTQGLSSSVYRNTFDLRNSAFPISHNYGLLGLVGAQSLNSSGFKISENSFLENLPDQNNPNPIKRFGSDIRNSDIYSGVVPFSIGEYKMNSHSNISYGTILEGDNSLLEVRCNAYHNYKLGIQFNYNSPSGKKPFFGECGTDQVDRNNTFNLGAYDDDLELLSFGSSGNQMVYVVK